MINKNSVNNPTGGNTNGMSNMSNMNNLNTYHSVNKPYQNTEDVLAQIQSLIN